MTTTAGSQGLRNRKQVASSSSDNNTKEQQLGLVSLDSSKKAVKKATTTAATATVAEQHDPFQLQPLLQRKTLQRLDVGPFVLLYGILISIDEADLDLPDLVASIIGQGAGASLQKSTILTALFGLALLMHICVAVACQWRVSVRATVGYIKLPLLLSESTMQRWTHCLVTSRQSSPGTAAAAGIVPVRIDTTAATAFGAAAEPTAVVAFQDRTFRYNASSLADLDVTLWNTTTNAATTVTTTTTASDPKDKGFRPLQYPVNLSLSAYASWKGHLHLPAVVAASQLYGPNVTVLELPSFTELLQEQVVAPFFLFQIFCVVLWSLDEYWYYAIFTLLALIMFESTVAYNRLHGLQRLHTAGHQGTQRVWVNRCEQWLTTTTRELVPGDLVSLTAVAAGSGGHEQVPADILVLQGTAVADEALLTGESVPQLKQALDMSGSSLLENAHAVLDMQQHKESILFGGTGLLVSNGGGGDDGDGEQGSTSSITKDPPPSSSVVGMVLRTGFETTQGNLLRTMAHSSNAVDGVHTWDTFVFILMLIGCALIAAWYVLDSGWNDERRNRFRLILHVVIIITSVVPPELPMELSLAVTNSVAALMNRCQVYCTELFRIPWAGEVDLCAFDKTGTITSDTMLLKGIRLFSGESTLSKDEDDALVHPSDDTLPWPVTRIMVACHSLALAGRSRGSPVVGDPMEKAVLKDTGYQVSGNNVVSSFAESAKVKNILILHRFAFSSRLKRMTVLVSEEGGAGKLWALVKGAPETIKERLSKGSVPDNYDDVSYHHMSRGRRVLAIAYRDVGSVPGLQSIKEGGRDSIECDLTFAGFIVLDCPIKSDSKAVISELRKSNHETVMITGDAILTAAEVARQVGIIRCAPLAEDRIAYEVQERSTGGDTDTRDVLSNFECVPLGAKRDSSKTLALSKANVGRLLDMAKTGAVSFCISGAVLTKIAIIAVRKERFLQQSTRLSTTDESHILLHPDAQSVLTTLVPLISVFARHAPHQKEAVIVAFNHGGFHTLMCGDGTNDVGALKRSHVGISIISAPEVESKQREANATMSRVKAEKKRERKLLKKGAKSPSRKQASGFEDSIRQMREAQEELDHVELGDASVAAPFTSRAVSIKCCKDVIQQGRCTLVTMLQIYKILGINCLVNALVLSKLFLHGVKQGDRQLTVLGLVVAALFFFVTRAEPLPTLSAMRPPTSVLCTEALLSIALQCVIHFAAILLATEVALSFVDPYDPSMIPDGPFNPNVLNTCTFLLTCLSTINTFAVNYRGRPFMADLQENKLMYRSLQGCYAFLLICVLEVFPPFNDLLQLTSFPTLEDAFSDASPGMLTTMVRTVDFPVFMCGLMAVDTLLVFGVEHIIVRSFEGTKKE